MNRRPERRFGTQAYPKDPAALVGVDTRTHRSNITDAVACSGLDKEHFRQFLQCWALLQMEPLYKVAQEIAPALSKPASEVVCSQQVFALDLPACGPLWLELALGKPC